MSGERPSRPQSAGVPPGDIEHARDARALRARRPLSTGLFLALALLYLIPIWSVDHLPTSDGPSHLYNAWILHELIAGDTGTISRHYAIDWRPHPNWIGQAALALLMSIVPPVIAEKILFSAIVLLFLWTIWMLAGRYAFIAFPFAYHHFLQRGRYDISIAIAIFLLIVAVWWVHVRHLPRVVLPLPRRVQTTLLFLLIAVAVANLGYLTARFRSADRLMTDFLRSAEAIPRETTLLPLIYDRHPVYSHLIDYTAIENRLVDLSNATGDSPLKARPIETAPAQTIFIWHMPLHTRIQKQIEEHYRLMSAIGGGRVYRSLILEPPSISRLPKILLPLAGTVGESDVWRVEQSVRNGGKSTAHLIASTCVLRCEFDLAPGQQMPFASTDKEMPFIIVYLARGSAKDLTFSTIVYRGDNPLVEIPAVHESAFQRRKTRIANVPFGGARLNVRAWFFGKGPDLFIYRILSRDGRLLGEKVGEVGPTAFFNRDDLSKAFPQIPPTEFVDVEVDTRSDDMRVWAFVTATDFDGGRVKLHLPQGGM